MKRPMQSWLRQKRQTPQNRLIAAAHAVDNIKKKKERIPPYLFQLILFALTTACSDRRAGRSFS